jgi:4-(gamma-glutamylamino)butanal dehydrogenase
VTTSDQVAATDWVALFGGVKLSGFGRDKSRHALAEYFDLKTTWIRHG